MGIIPNLERGYMNNYSKQREIILETFKYLNHPTAEQIYDKAHQDNPTISKSTVYRNLKW